MVTVASNPFPIVVRADGPTVLATAAASLGPGEWIDFPEGLNPLARALDIQWNTVTMYYDPLRRELQYMGKPASGQSLEHRHYIYDEATNTWRTTGRALFPGTGHIWSHAFDPVTGNYYFHRWTDDFVWIMDRSVEAGAGETNAPWRQTRRQSEPDLGGSNAGPVAALCWHPSLFGADRPGLIDYGKFRLFAWDPASDTWHVMARYGTGSPFWAHAGGQGVYVPALDRAVLGTGKDQGYGRPLIAVDAEAGLEEDGIAAGVIRSLGDPPRMVSGTGGTTISARFLPHPSDPRKLVMLETYGESAVWVSEDGGATWAQSSDPHPFNGMPADSRGMWTCGAIPAHGVVWAMTSRGDGDGSSRLWRPPA